MGATVSAVLIAMSFLPCESPAVSLPNIRETVVEVCPGTVRMLYSAPLEAAEAAPAPVEQKAVKKVPKKKKPAKKSRRAKKRR